MFKCFSYLLFVDDTLIFSEPNINHLRSLRVLLLCFETILELRINLSKPEIVPIGSIPNIYDLSNILGCRVTLLPLRYLNLPFGAPYKSVTI